MFPQTKKNGYLFALPFILMKHLCMNCLQFFRWCQYQDFL